ncbi:MAG: hypothetical protein WC869_11340 [Phycisphaerae bacterium]|jgi:hypothetical protein
MTLKKSMTGRERMLATLRFEPPARVAGPGSSTSSSIRNTASKEQ